jgi:hypothetical protein
MSKRLQVLLDEAELRDIQRLARRKQMSVADWVRRALRAARRAENTRDPGRKLDAIRRATAHQFPTADIDEMLKDIERGYLDSRHETS